MVCIISELMYENMCNQNNLINVPTHIKQWLNYPQSSFHLTNPQLPASKNFQHNPATKNTKNKNMKYLNLIRVCLRSFKTVGLQVNVTEKKQVSPHQKTPGNTLDKMNTTQF